MSVTFPDWTTIDDHAIISGILNPIESDLVNDPTTFPWTFPNFAHMKRSSNDSELILTFNHAQESPFPPIFPITAEALLVGIKKLNEESLQPNLRLQMLIQMPAPELHSCSKFDEEYILTLTPRLSASSSPNQEASSSNATGALLERKSGPCSSSQQRRRTWRRTSCHGVWSRQKSS